MPWQAAARDSAYRLGIDLRYLRRFRWISKAREVRSVGGSLGANLRFVLSDPEYTNFTFELANEDQLVTWVAGTCDSPTEEIARLLEEARNDPILAARLHRATASRWWWTKRSPPFGKRLAWYALARVLKPKLIIETGVHDGLGSMLLLRALERNADEHAPGRLVSFDINARAGWLVDRHPLWELRIESSRAGLAAVLEQQGPVGIFIHDSLHTYEHERFEFELAASHLAPGGLLVTDNAHGTHALADVCQSRGLRYVEFHSASRDHFYPGEATGAGIAR